MPIYEYRCKQCGQKFEIRQSVGEDGSGLSCPECESGNPERLISIFSMGRASIGAVSDAAPTCSTGLCNLPPR